VLRRFFAPGKVVLLGEYAVLDGAPALVAAVDHGVACEVREGPMHIETPAGTDDRFARPALAEVSAPAAHYRFVDAPPATTADKPGLGGSAAATVVALLAGSTLAGRPLSPEELHRLGHAVHHRVQGSGSGIDVAAAAHGGFLRFEASPGGPTVRPTTPHPLHLVYSGTSAATGPRVQRYRALADRTAFVRDSTALVDADLPLPEALRAGYALLVAMAERAGVDYLTPGLQRLCALAEAHGGGAKPSGAGGGDIAVAAFDDPEAASAFHAAVRAEGFVTIPAGVAPGAREA
jgi:phosphomevalonate kinase